MIIRENTLHIKDIVNDNIFEMDNNIEVYKHAIFFDLEHYVYKKPICIGVFGCCYYDDDIKALIVTQYMIENKKEAKDILFMAEEYFNKMYNDYHKRYIVTFSGNNDFTVINHLFKKYNIIYNFNEYFEHMDIQKMYEKVSGVCIGLKNLEKKFEILRDSETISGANLAKTFSKVMKDEYYITRMPEEKIKKILLYNEQDVVNLFHIFVNWNSYVSYEEDDNDIVENE